MQAKSPERHLRGLVYCKKVYERLHGAEHRVISDRIEAGSLMAAAGDYRR
jgi:hypothetical protein